MSGGVWLVLGWVVVIGLPLAVWLWAMCWPERIPPERSVDGIRERIEAEERHSRRRPGPGGYRRPYRA